jgi:hypothetical protein
MNFHNRIQALQFANCCVGYFIYGHIENKLKVLETITLNIIEHGKALKQFK